MTNALQELIAQHCDQTGETLADIAARGGMARQTVSGLMHRDGPRAVPRDATLRGLAVGLGLPFEVVRRAAAQATFPEHEDVHQRRIVNLLVALTENLSDAQVSVIVATARAMQPLASGHNGTSADTPEHV